MKPKKQKRARVDKNFIYTAQLRGKTRPEIMVTNYFTRPRKLTRSHSCPYVICSGKKKTVAPQHCYNTVAKMAAATNEK